MQLKKFVPFFLLLLVITLSSCGHSYKVDGTTSVSYMDGKTLYLKVLKNDKWVNMDSAQVVHGTFTMKGSIDSIMVASLYMDNESLMPVVMESGTIKIEITDNDMKVSGTPLNEKLYTFIDKKNQLESKAQDLDHEETQMMMNGQDANNIQMTMNQRKDSLQNALTGLVKGFITDNYNNALGPTVFIMVCSNMQYPIMTPQIAEILKDAPDTFKNHPLVSEFISKAEENAKLMMEQQRMEQNQAQHQQQPSQGNNTGGNNMQQQQAPATQDQQNGYQGQ